MKESVKMTVIFVLIISTLNGLSFLWWSWRTIRRFDGDHRESRLATFGIRGILGFWPLILLILWLLSDRSSITVQIIELVAASVGSVLDYVYIVRDRYLLNDSMFRINQFKQLGNTITSLVAICYFNIIMSLGIALHLLRWWPSDSILGYLGMAVLYLFMFGILSITVRIKHKRERPAGN